MAQLFCKTDLDLVISEFLSRTLHYKKKTLKKLLNVCVMYFLMYLII